MDRPLSIQSDMLAWGDAVGTFFLSIAGFLRSWPSTGLELLWGLGPFVIVVGLCLVNRGWLQTLAVILLTFIPAYTAFLLEYAAIGASADSAVGFIERPAAREIIAYGSAIVWLLAFFAALVLAQGARSARARKLLLAEQDDRLEELDTALFQERFWRKASGDDRSVIPSEEVIELAHWVQEPILQYKKVKADSMASENDDDINNVEDIPKIKSKKKKR